MAERTGKRLKDLVGAADFLRLPVETVRSLAAAGYLTPSGESDDAGPVFAVSDLKGFVARNAEGGAAELLDGLEEAPDPKVLLDALDARSEEMARRALDIFQSAVPEATIWTSDDQARFVEQARKRFEAILAVTGQGQEVDEALVGDLREVGASAAWAGSPLPQLLVVLRISRDLVVQTAVEVAEERGRRWGLALSLLLTRVLPAMDRLTDALAQGYWAAVVGREETERARHEHLVEHSSDGVYELDVTGHVSYANPSLAAMVGRSVAELEGARLGDVFHVVGDPDVLDRLWSGADHGEEDLEIVRPDGVRRELHVVAFPRRLGERGVPGDPGVRGGQVGEVAGYQGVVRDVTAAREAERARSEFLAMVTHDLRTPITTILGLGVTLEAYAGELPPERVQRMGGVIRRQAERISRLADDLYEVSRLESRTLRLNLRATAVGPAVEAALGSLAAPAAVAVDVADGLVALADPRRLEQVVANLVENALTHGAPPVSVVARETGEGVELSVVDSGPGVPPAAVADLFSRVAPGGGGHSATGLFLVRGLVEAMGGSVAYEPGPDGAGAAFRVRLTRPPRR